MKVIQINSVCGIGSTGRIATDIHEKLNQLQNDSYIIYGRKQARHCDNAIRIGSSISTVRHLLKTVITGSHGFGSMKETEEIIETIKMIDPDIIHLHNIHGYYINLSVLFNYLEQVNKPVVWTLHDCWAFTGHCAYFDFAGCDKWKRICERCPQRTSYPFSLLHDNSKKNYARKKILFNSVANMTFVTPSRWLLSNLKMSFINKYPSEVINNGINLSMFKPTNSNFRARYDLDGKFIILGVANIWEKRKGLRYFIELSKQLEDDEVIVIVGLSKLQMLMMGKNIIGLSRTQNQQELVEIYSAADVFFNPTLEETMGMVNVESLACGTPVITFNTGGSIECVDESTGYIIGKGSLNEARECISIVKSRGKLYYSHLCIARARALYDKEAKISEYINLYNRLYQSGVQ